ncbi:hypothetical protein [uncultured Aquimarina sp.]|uniref:hypothetical protein n=1 Tax=uncultured Aquimarina sp. TaxID=575652 RepID=UPI00260DDE54|nr:hypothetical protein [uncultured Aquimarina sp.]
MKKIRIVSSLILGIVFSSYGQTNKIENTGNVGIGTTTPAEKLEVRGNINSEKFQIRTPSSGSWFNITSPNGSNRFDINRRYNGDIPLMSVLTSGNVGIGTKTPNTVLHIKKNQSGWLQEIAGTASNNGDFVGLKVLSGYAGETNKWIGISAIAENLHSNATGLGLYTGATERFRIQHNGNVGIGTTSPDAKLHLNALERNALRIYRETITDKYLNIWHGTSGAVIEPIRTDGETSSLYLGGYDTPTNVFLSANGGNVGIGTTSPNAKLQITSTSIDEFSTNRYDANLIIEGTNTSRSVSKGATLGFVVPANTNGGNSWQQGRIMVTPDNESNANASGRMLLQTRYINNGAWRWRNNLILTSNGNVGIGTADTKGFKLGVKGKIAAEEVKVALYNTWPDYVFENDYNLPSLQQVENHIVEKGHLENIPSAAEVVENGIQLGEMNSKLLQKIEELTLYMIEQNKKTENQQKEIYKLQEENKKLKSTSSMLIELQMRLEKLESKTK